MENEQIYKKALSVLERGDKILNEMAHPNIGMTMRDLFYELQMGWLAISTRKRSDNAISDYYLPLFYEKIIKLGRRVNQALYEGGGDWYDFMDADENAAPTEMDIFRRKKILDTHIKKSNVLSALKESTFYGLAMGMVVQETVPCNDSQLFNYSTKEGEATMTRTVEVPGKLIKSRYVDLMDLYITDPYCEDLSQDFGVLKEYRWSELKQLEARGYFQNVDAIKENNYQNPFNLSDSYRSVRKNLLKFDGSTKGLEEYKKAEKYVVADIWFTQEEEIEIDIKDPVSGEFFKSTIAENVWYVASVCGNAVLRVKRAIELYGVNKHPYKIWKDEYVNGFFYGYGRAARLIKTQWAQNQIFNLGIDGIIKKLNGNFFASAKVKETIDAQIKGGMKSGGVIAVPVPTNQGVRDVIYPIDYPDPSNLFISTSEYLNNIYSNVSGLSRVSEGSPTRSQLDRTASAYQAAVVESSADIKDIVYTFQERFVSEIITQCFMIVSRTMWRKILVGKYFDKASQKFIQVWGAPEDMYGLPDIEVFGGSMYLDRQKQKQDLLEVLNIVQANAKFGERIEYEKIMQKIVDLNHVDMDVVRPQTMEEKLSDMLNSGIPVEQIQQAVNDLAFAKQEQMAEMEYGKQVDAKQKFIHGVNTEMSFRKAQENDNRMNELDAMVEAAKAEEL